MVHSSAHSRGRKVQNLRQLLCTLSCSLSNCYYYAYSTWQLHFPGLKGKSFEFCCRYHGSANRSHSMLFSDKIIQSRKIPPKLWRKVWQINSLDFSDCS